MATLVTINDGQYRWGADAARLRAALADQGWHEVSVYVGGGPWEGEELWEEPATGPDEDSTAAYTALCGAVDSLAGEGGTAPLTEELAATAESFTYRPDLGGWLWTRSEGGRPWR